MGWKTQYGLASFSQTRRNVLPSPRERAYYYSLIMYLFGLKSKKIVCEPLGAEKSVLLFFLLITEYVTYSTYKELD
jgi:hypothetical protein